MTVLNKRSAAPARCRAGLLLCVFALAVSAYTPPYSFVRTGDPIHTSVGEEIHLRGEVFSPDIETEICMWDFDGDGDWDWSGSPDEPVIHVYTSVGVYKAVFSAVNIFGDTIGVAGVKITVDVEGASDAVYKASADANKPESAPRPADGVEKRYAILFNGSPETRFWEDMRLAYDMLISERYGLAAADVYLLHNEGLDPSGENPDNRIDGAGTAEELRATCDALARVIDGDDLLFFWATGHGAGNYGVDHKYFGYSHVPPHVQEGDEQDYLESDYKMRSLYTGGEYARNHGMDEWTLYYYRRNNYWVRHKYVSSIDNIYIETLDSVVSDNDVYIESFLDLLAGDINKDRYIDEDEGEVVDYDGDGIAAYNPETGEFDEDDWGEVDILRDNYNHRPTALPQGVETWRLFDKDMDNRLDIDFNPDPEADTDPARLVADATDIDGEGFFDNVDVNADGDLEDWVSLDEDIQCAGGGSVTDDEMREMMASLRPAAFIQIYQQCFSGGFLWDLRGPNRAIMAASHEEMESFGNTFIRNAIAALSGERFEGRPLTDPALADVDTNGSVDVVEMFNFAAENDLFPEDPQFCDTPDGATATDPLPAAGDIGLWASSVHLAANRSFQPTVWINTAAGDYTKHGSIESALGAAAPDDAVKANRAAYHIVNHFQNDQNNVTLSFAPGTRIRVDAPFYMGETGSIAAQYDITVEPSIVLVGSHLGATPDDPIRGLFPTVKDAFETSPVMHTTLLGPGRYPAHEFVATIESAIGVLGPTLDASTVVYKSNDADQNASAIVLNEGVDDPADNAMLFKNMVWEDGRTSFERPYTLKLIGGGQFDLENITFVNTKPEPVQSGVIVEKISGVATLKNCTFIHYANGLHLDWGTTAAEGCIFSRNEVGIRAGVMRNIQDISNNNFYANASAHLVHGSETYTDIAAVNSVTGGYNSAVAPQFVDELEHDFRLAPSSALVDAHSDGYTDQGAYQMDAQFVFPGFCAGVLTFSDGVVIEFDQGHLLVPTMESPHYEHVRIEQTLRNGLTPVTIITRATNSLDLTIDLSVRVSETGEYPATLREDFIVVEAMMNATRYLPEDGAPVCLRDLPIENVRLRPDNIAPAPRQDVYAASVPGAIEIRWTPDGESHRDKIYRAPSAASLDNMTQLASLSPYTGVSVDTGGDTSAIYAVIGYDRTGNQSAPVYVKAAMENVTPVFNGLSVINRNTFAAAFGFDNPNDFPVTLSWGPRNQFAYQGSGGQYFGQPTTFAPGGLDAACTVQFDGSELAWTLDGTTVTASGPNGISPVVEFVEDNGDGTYTAHFGYYNRNNFTVAIPIGAENKFHYHGQSDLSLGQPVQFIAGRHWNYFTVDFDGSHLVWALFGKSATATGDQAD